MGSQGPMAGLRWQQVEPVLELSTWAWPLGENRWVQSAVREPLSCLLAQPRPLENSRLCRGCLGQRIASWPWWRWGRGGMLMTGRAAWCSGRCRGRCRATECCPCGGRGARGAAPRWGIGCGARAGRRRRRQRGRGLGAGARCRGWWDGGAGSAGARRSARRSLRPRPPPPLGLWGAGAGLWVWGGKRDAACVLLLVSCLQDSGLGENMGHTGAHGKRNSQRKKKSKEKAFCLIETEVTNKRITENVTAHSPWTERQK